MYLKPNTLERKTAPTETEQENPPQIQSSNHPDIFIEQIQH